MNNQSSYLRAAGTDKRFKSNLRTKQSIKLNQPSSEPVCNRRKKGRTSALDIKSKYFPVQETLSIDNRRKYPVSNEEIINFLLQEETTLYLEKIFNEEIPSERHDIVCKMFRSGKLDFGIHSKIFNLAQMQFLEDDHRIDLLLYDIMNRLFDRVDVSRVPGLIKGDKDAFDSQANHFRHKYIFHVLVPEGIVKYLQEKKEWDKQTAERFYLDGESRVTNLELKEFDEELAEYAKRERERKLRDTYEISEEESEDEMGVDSDNERNLELPNLDEPENDVEKFVLEGTK